MTHENVDDTIRYDTSWNVHLTPTENEYWWSKIEQHSPRLALNNWQASLCVSPLARISSSNLAGLELSTAPPRAVVPSQPNSNTSFFVVGPRISAWSDDDDDDDTGVPATTNAVAVLVADRTNESSATQSFMVESRESQILLDDRRGT